MKPADGQNALFYLKSPFRPTEAIESQFKLCSQTHSFLRSRNQ